MTRKETQATPRKENQITLSVTYSSENRVSASSSSESLPRLILLNLLVLPWGLFDWKCGRPGRVLFTSLKILLQSFAPASLAPALGEVGKATTADARFCCSRWNLQRKDPGWFVGEHIHVIFTGDEDDETDFLGETDAEGRRPSGDDARSLPLPPFTLDLLLELADNERGLSTAFNKFEACILKIWSTAQNRYPQVSFVPCNRETSEQLAHSERA